ncbi:MAG TPA: DUF692 domain-containing protein [Polyangiaceae bacterium]|nr:DUF692 domain-containing protein [Polyangiaceae bacterium]
MKTPTLELQRRGGDATGMPIGIGLRAAHYEAILAERPRVEWFELLSDNYMHTRGRPLAYADRIAQRYPVALHGVGLSLGSVDPLDLAYLAELRSLRDRVAAGWVSDHIAWTGVNGRRGHDLYPVPFTEECLRHIARRVCQVQDYLGTPLVLENPSTYLEFAGATLSEPEFIAALLEETGAGLLLDVNNVYVNATNHGFDAGDYLRRLPLARVAQLHLSGHDTVRDAQGRVTQRIDTHAGPVAPAVWALFEQAVRLGARAPVLLEWDAEIPSFAVVHAEALLARGHIERALAAAVRPSAPERVHARCEELSS